MYINGMECLAISTSVNYITSIEYNGSTTSLTLTGNNIYYHAKYILVTQSHTLSTSGTPFTTDSTSASTATSMPVIEPSGESNGNESEEPKLKSSHAEIGIGVGVALGVLAVLIGIFIVWKRQKRRESMGAEGAGSEMRTHVGSAEIDGNWAYDSGPHELSGTRELGELDSSHSPGELDSNHSPGELDSMHSPAELYSRNDVEKGL
jgi:hypothetical protein